MPGLSSTWPMVFQTGNAKCDFPGNPKPAAHTQVVLDNIVVI